MDASELRQKATHYRRVVDLVSDDGVAEALLELAAEYASLADRTEGLGRPIPPRMSGRIGADVMLLPVRRCAVLVMRLQHLTIVHAVITKNCAALVQRAPITHQHIPEVVADFVAEVTKQRNGKVRPFGCGAVHAPHRQHLPGLW
jgi:hypothetical protein